MKVFAWIYAVIGTMYFLMNGHHIVVKYDGPLWLLLVAAPFVLSLLVVTSLAARLGLFDSRS